MTNDARTLEMMKQRLEELVDAERVRVFEGGTHSNAATDEPLTVASLEKALRDIDPDGRMLQEARLCVAARRLPKETVEMLIGMAERLAVCPIAAVAQPERDLAATSPEPSK